MNYTTEQVTDLVDKYLSGSISAKALAKWINKPEDEVKEALNELQELIRRERESFIESCVDRLINNY